MARIPMERLMEKVVLEIRRAAQEISHSMKSHVR
jgi:hypothetical protein